MTILNRKEVLEKIAALSFLDEKIIKNLIDPLRKELSVVSGIFLLLSPNEHSVSEQSFFPEKKVDFSLRDVVFLIKEIIKKLTTQKPLPFSFKIPKIKLKEEIRRLLIFVFLLGLVLTVGFFLIQVQKNRTIKEINAQIEKVEKEITEIKVTKNGEQEKISLLLPIYEKISIETHPRFNQIKENLRIEMERLSMLENLNNLEPIFTFVAKEFTPQQLLYFDPNLYLFSSFSEKVVQINTKTLEKNIHHLPQNPKMGAIINSGPLFFVQPNLIFSLTQKGLTDHKQLKLPFTDSSLTNFISFGNNLYFEDSNKIFKYKEGESHPTSWFLPETKKPSSFQSMSADGSLWILEKDNTILRYYRGNYIERLSLTLFPAIKGISQIFTSSQTSYLFLLEPIGRRLIITDKQGQVIRQIQSEQFSNLTHFWVSDKNIFLLSGLEIYQIAI